MEIVITGRQIAVPERFRQMANEKLAKVAQLSPKTQQADVEISHERNPRLAPIAEKVEITLSGKGPVVRAEARAESHAAALDLALDKLLERLRRSNDRRKAHNQRQAAKFAAELVDGAREEAEDAKAQEAAASQAAEADESPVVIRTKDHQANPMSLDQALYEMELVGHDFFLFIDEQSGRPSVVYRRQGWHYGVIRLAPADQ